MKQLPYRFAEKVPLQVSDVNAKTGINNSMIARAAMQIGLEHIRKLEGDALVDKIVVSDAKARN